jgi:hypothetical protein
MNISKMMLWAAAICIANFLSGITQTSAQPHLEEYTEHVMSRNVKSQEKEYMPWNEYATRTIATLKGFQKGREPQLDMYGGRTDLKFKKTGFYYVVNDKGRWWNVDPEGNAFINVGVVAVLPGESEKQGIYAQQLYGSTAKWSKATHELLLENGFNSLGAWSKYQYFKEDPLQRSHPISYTIIKDFMSTYGKKRGGTYQESGHIGYPDKTIFVFDPEFESFCDEFAKDLTKNKDDKNLFGYFSDNELPFERTALDRYLNKKDTTDPGCIAAKKWLANQHLTKENINDSIRHEFLGVIADRYYSIVSKAIRKYDPNHLYLGSRLHFYELKVKPFLKAMGKYVDIIAINYYRVWTPVTQDMKNWSDWSGRPFIVTEWYTKGEDSGLPNYAGAGWIVKTQNDRGLFYQNFMLALLESGNCVGAHWFKYQDNDPENKKVDPSNYDSNKGIVATDYQLYSPLMDKMKELNTNLYSLSDFFDKRK